MNAAQQNIAKQQVARFVQRFEEAYRWLACYAALPLILTPELVNYLRNHFLHGQVPWVAEADLLLSDLCRPVGYEQYAMEPGVRAYLIGELRETLGEERLQEVARLLIRYVHQLKRMKSASSLHELQAEQWSAMAYIGDLQGEVAREITAAFRDQLVAGVSGALDGNILIGETELARLVRITQELAPQLQAYPELLHYAEDVGKLLADPARLAAVTRQQEPDRDGATTQVLDITLPALDSLSKTQLTLKKLLEELNHPLTTHQERAVVGGFLDELGDPRPGVGLNEQGLPDIIWCQVPAGSVGLEGGAGTFAVESFFMAKYPVTYTQYKAFLDARNGYRDKQWWKGLYHVKTPGEQYHRFGNCPAENVSWYDSIAFCRWLSEQLGYEVRLPTEWEWQQAATGGNPDNTYPWGPEWDDRRANTRGSELNQTTAVGMYPGGASAQGVLDLAGNVWEWCLNKYDKPKDISLSGDDRVVRGGSWYLTQDLARAACRSYFNPVNRDYVIGFRVCRSSPS